MFGYAESWLYEPAFLCYIELYIHYLLLFFVAFILDDEYSQICSYCDRQDLQFGL